MSNVNVFRKTACSDRDEKDSDSDNTYDPLESNSDSDSNSDQDTSDKESTLSPHSSLPTDEEETEKPYKKPYKFCIFCKTAKSKLSQHIVKQHAKDDRVKAALKLPPHEQSSMLDLFKKEGILELNKLQAKTANPSYHRERRSATDTSLVMCNICSGFYSRSYIKRHSSSSCQGKSESCQPSAPIPVALLQCDEDYGGQFVSDVLIKFRQDKVGKVCTSDAVLLKIGRRLWYKQKRKVDKKVEVRKSVMTDMRRMANLYLHMLDQEEQLGPFKKKEGNISDLFVRGNFHHLEQAMDVYTSRGDSGEGDDVKSGLKSSLYWLLKSSSKILKALYLIEDADQQADNIDTFVSILELNKNYMFGDAIYKVNQQRQIRLRRPEELPVEDDIKQIRKHTLERMQEITSDEYDFWDSSRYVELRDLVVCRLTLFKARRGGEPSRLLSREWEDAEKGVWLDTKQVEALDNGAPRILS